ncbi:hypothetical protein [Salinicola aestuarinus]|uniref:hypothetical protein n=1 Tax=Salinicola aestuarinus TaxID=1949082 RepID=UPI000DA26722|nr:hypothetical protein [Salinicola aestuarinus]
MTTPTSTDAPSDTLLDIANRTIQREDADGRAYEAFYEAFQARRFYIVVKPMPDGEVGIAFRESHGVQSLVAGEDRELLLEKLDTEGLALQEVTGFAILRLTEQEEFVLGIMEGREIDDWLLLTYEQLVLLARIANMQATPSDTDPTTEAPQPPPYPKAFVDWLYRYCRDNHDIERCWFVIATIGSPRNLDVAVMLDSGGDSYHLERIRQQARSAFVASVHLYDEAGLSRIAREDMSANVRRHPPLFDRRHSQHFLARGLRALRRHPVTHLRIDVEPDVEPK